MHPRELIHRINNLEARVAELETRLQSLEIVAVRGDAAREFDERLQSIEDWRQTFERPPRERLQVRK